MSVANTSTQYELGRLGTIMEPDPNNPDEAWGVLNPASARGRDGELYLFPRVVAQGNYSRIGIARVNFEHGDPVGTTRLGYVLEPEESYEWSPHGSAGVEDPRVTYVEPLACWVMAYTAVSEFGPRIALATSHDLFRWERLGVINYDIHASVDLNLFDNKDGMFFPDVVLDPWGKPALALLHRPRYLRHSPDGTVALEVPEEVREERESIWIGYIALDAAKRKTEDLVKVYATELLAAPEEPWECLKIGGGSPPVRVDEGWLTFYHGVSGTISSNPNIPKDVRYSAGAMVLDPERPTKVLYRSKHPVLEPDEHHEKDGIVPNVVFPTAIDRRDDGRFDVYYGMADSRIGAARTKSPGGERP